MTTYDLPNLLVFAYKISNTIHCFKSRLTENLKINLVSVRTVIDE